MKKLIVGATVLVTVVVVVKKKIAEKKMIYTIGESSSRFQEL
ncbi:hypothetical protein [Salinicoccus albus]|nr:hypothetical protein [Salinicoccus albus]